MKTSTVVVLVAAAAGIALVGYAATKMMGGSLSKTGQGNTGSDNKAGGGASGGDWGSQAALLLGALGNLGVGKWSSGSSDKTDDGWGKEGTDWIWVTPAS